MTKMNNWNVKVMFQEEEENTPLSYDMKAV